MQIFIKTDSGKTITIDIEGTDTIGEVKRKIYEKQEINPELSFRLTYQQRYLNDENTVDSYNIQKESTLWMVWPFAGDNRAVMDGPSVMPRAA